jgi:2,4-dienoyl-CoA reductase (NADPH2)
MTAYPHLFSPLKVGALKLANRITMAPMYMGYSNLAGEITPQVLEHYREMGASGVGLVVVENASVDPEGVGSPFIIRAEDDRFTAGLAKLAETVKAGGAKVSLQLNHAGRFAFVPEAKAPSAVAFGEKTPVPLTASELKAIARRFAAAARRVKEAGFDAVELHGGTGYLLAQFVSPHTNRREDEYGGSLENRLRFPREVIAAVREAVGPDFTLGYRFLADEWLPGGLTLHESMPAAQALAVEGLDYLSVMGGTYESFFLPEKIQAEKQPGYMSDLAAAVKKVVDIPVIAAGRIQSPGLAEELLNQGKADMIGLARVLVADPEWPSKAAQGREEEIIACEPNCQLCFKRVSQGKTIACSQWPKEKRARFQERI